MHSIAGRTRRGFLGTIARGTLAGAIALGGGPALASTRLAIPEGPMILSRRLVRGLHDGKTITVDRSWKVWFAPREAGFAITGQQVSARVDAPGKLAPIAQIEQSRSTAKMWPIELADNGRIVTAGTYTEQRDIEAAIREGRAIIEASAGSDSYKARKLSYLSQLEQAGGSLLEKLPSDLFFPAGSASEVVDTVELPGGVTGTFEVIYKSVPAGEGSWLARAERRVTTRIGDDARQSSDSWQLDPV
jgi:hypothetical protein